MKTIHVYAGWAAIDQPVPVGVASASLARGKEVISFEFDRDWIRNFAGLLLDPKLRMTLGPQYADRGERGGFAC